MNYIIIFGCDSISLLYILVAACAGICACGLAELVQKKRVRDISKYFVHISMFDLSVGA